MLAKRRGGGWELGGLDQVQTETERISTEQNLTNLHQTHFNNLVFLEQVTWKHSGFSLLQIFYAVGHVFTRRVQVSVRKCHQPPAHGEQQPAADECRGEDDQREAPFKVHQRGEDVLQESPLFADVLVRQVARAVFGDKARFVHAVPEHRLAGHPGDEPRETELLRDDAFPRQHLLVRFPLPMAKKTVLSASLRTDAACPPSGKRSKTNEQL